MLILDRFEEDLAVCETVSGFIRIPRSLLPPEAHEGCVLVQSEGKYQIDSEKTQERARISKEKLAKVLKNFDFLHRDSRNNPK
jgi:hypothetical protein